MWFVRVVTSYCCTIAPTINVCFVVYCVVRVPSFAFYAGAARQGEPMARPISGRFLSRLLSVCESLHRSYDRAQVHKLERTRYRNDTKLHVPS